MVVILQIQCIDVVTDCNWIACQNKTYVAIPRCIYIYIQLKFSGNRDCLIVIFESQFFSLYIGVIESVKTK